MSTFYFLAVMLACVFAGWLCGGLRKTAATFCAAVFCAMLSTGALFAKNMSWLPDWMVCDAASLLQSTWYAPPAAALMAIGLRRARLNALEANRPAMSLARVLVLLAAISGVLTWAGLSGLNSRLEGPALILAEIEGHPEFVSHGVILQSTVYTCGPAACATLLRLTGASPEASERELIALCRTQHRNGTTILSAAAGLKGATAGTDWRVKLVEPPFEKIAHLPLPAIVTVKLANGAGHVVVLCALEPERALIADPADKDGQVYWKIKEFKARYLGEALTLTR